MRLTTKLSAMITLLSALAMLLMLLGCVISFFYLSDERAGHRLLTMAKEIDSTLTTETPEQMVTWLPQVMGPLQIHQVIFVENGQKRLALARHQDAVLEDEPNKYRQTEIRLENHPAFTLNIIWVDTTKTWLCSFVGASIFTIIIFVVSSLILILLFTHRWLYRQLQGMEFLEHRAGMVLKGERSSVRHGNVHEWPPKASSAIDLLLSDLHEAGEQRNRIDTLIRSFAAKDAKTGLNNRMFFDNQLSTMLEDTEGTESHGMVMMIRLPDLDTLRDYWGPGQTKDYLFDLVNLLSTFVMRYPGALLARYFRSDFAVLLPHRSLKDADGIASQLIHAVDALPPMRMLDREDMIHIGISGWHSGQSTQQVMESVEVATRHAALSGGNNWSVGEVPQQDRSRGSVKWRTLLESTLQRGGVRLYQKPAVTGEGNVHHREMMPRIFDGDKELSSAEYLPFVQQLGMAEGYDRQLVSRILALLPIFPGETLAIPLTVDALLRRSFQFWLGDMLLQYTQSQRNYILFELAEADVCQQISRLNDAFRLLKGFGCRIAISQAGLTVVSTGYIKPFDVELIKLHPGLVRNIERRTENQLFVQSLVESCKRTPTRVFAAGVKSQAEWHTLAELGIQGGQGDYFAPSELLNSEVKKFSQRFRV
ncbi:RNase E specificity factor CsrD [Erwinia psidii]|uniref:RNase E specificity factor CsrD n=1 Tax=Erwinia psidii TaxID=69224 RepID=A0A3N6UN12_9GAMM|nr:RNase E specificity factor CsrD [Erwinia psidii]MCX8958590.1 RNase E specificity factor CsrD [Erwinia psidii]MCX8962094.1 RNase E specificity factor CsrD [Erwinia psidii]MCX8965576.1 RNase E specificity factor CsrD [Erwinia psidii]RQM37319.1 RNase E specificity factor CsrD [Erwinia psidii]